MNKKENAKNRIAVVAWKLFHEKGYENTTIDEIILQSGTSKGSFYHYYSSKDELLASLSDVFDSWYADIVPTIDPDMNSFDKLIYICCYIHSRIEKEIPVELLSYLYASQVTTKGHKQLANQNRYYFKIVNQLVDEGQRRGQITASMPYYEVSHLYTMCERAIIYDYCISGGEYSLGEYTKKVMPGIFGCVKGNMA